MEGLAKRLRKLSEYVIQAPPVEYEQAASWAMSDAADAIEMQTAALTALRLQCRDHEKAVDALRAENAKLREALMEAVRLYGKPGGPWNVPSDPGGWLAMARAALGNKP